MKCGGGGGGGGGGFNCRDLQGYTACLLSVGTNAALGSIPVLGTALGLAGVKVDFNNPNGLTVENPFNLNTANDIGEKYVNQQYNSKGGDSRLESLDWVANRSGLGKRTRSLRSSLSALKSIGKALPIVGIGLSAYEAALGITKCYEVHCN